MKQSIQNNTHNILTLATIATLLTSFITLITLAFTHVNLLDMIILNDFGMLIQVITEQPVLTVTSIITFLLSGIGLTYFLNKNT